MNRASLLFTVVLPLTVSCASAFDGEAPVTADTTSALENGPGADCAVTAPDATCGTAVTSCTQRSAPRYDHAACAHAFVVDGQFAGERGGTVEARYDADLVDGISFPCAGMWVRAYVWQRTESGWVLAGEDVSYGAAKGSLCSRPVVSVPVESGAEYKVVSQAGYIYGYLPVSTAFVPK
jgi:hypothetical protein